MYLVVLRKWTHLFPIVMLHPYGRRRRGVNGLMGAVMLKVDNMYSCPFILGLMYKLIRIRLRLELFFEEI